MIFMPDYGPRSALEGIRYKSERSQRMTLRAVSALFQWRVDRVTINRMTFEDHKKRRGPLEEFATVHEKLTTAAELFEKLRSFDDAKWAFRGQGRDWPLTARIDRHAIRPGVAEDYAMREFRRRVHHYLRDVPQRDEDLEWLALMQHYGAPTRLLDWTRSSEVATFFAAQSSNSASPCIRTPADPLAPFVIWALDTASINAEATITLELPSDTDLSSTDAFRKIYWPQPAEELYLVVAVQPYRMNERLTIQQGLFVCANRALVPFHNCLAGLLLHARKKARQSAEWLHKIVVAAETRADVLRSLNKVNINAATLFPGLDGFCQSLQVAVQLQELDVWPGVSLAADRESWVKGT